VNLIGGVILAFAVTAAAVCAFYPRSADAAPVSGHHTEARALTASPDEALVSVSVAGQSAGETATTVRADPTAATRTSADQPAASPVVATSAAPSSTVVSAVAVPTSDACDVRPTVAADGFDPFYTQICVVGGIPLLGSDDVDSRALVAAARIVTAVLAPRPDLKAQMVARHMRVGVLGLNHKAVDLPEYRDLPVKYPETNWNAARAYSATPARPLLSGPEENLVCSPADTYPGQQVLVHEMGHSVMDLAVRYLDPAFWDRVQRAYDRSMAAGRWVGYYGGSSATEYWAEGVQAYFDASRASAGPDPLGTPVDTREKLTAYDQELAGLIREVFTDNPWRASCP
jgi:alpha-glucosidase